jgi:hypothetical protein
MFMANICAAMRPRHAIFEGLDAFFMAMHSFGTDAVWSAAVQLSVVRPTVRIDS